MNTTKLIQVFNDTMETINLNPQLKKSTEFVCKNTVLYNEGFCSSKQSKGEHRCQLSVLPISTFSCAHLFVGSGKIAVLNFANPIEPGGGSRRGVQAQEECLCRCSNLYCSLTESEAAVQYYKYHNEHNNHWMFSDRIIYSPGITVFKADETYEILQNPFQVDAITCAAPYEPDIHDSESIMAVYKTRITNIFEVAVEHEVDILILGAFGCGVFCNPPQLMARAFRELIYNKYYRCFKHICFAIMASSANDKNYSVFLEIIGNMN